MRGLTVLMVGMVLFLFEGCAGNAESTQKSDTEDDHIIDVIDLEEVEPYTEIDEFIHVIDTEEVEPDTEIDDIVDLHDLNEEMETVTTEPEPMEDPNLSEPDVQEIDDCMCDSDEVCVTNEAVTDECFKRDCPYQACDEEEVCYNQECVREACAGVDCPGFNICRGGVCNQGCGGDGPDIHCPSGYCVVEDVCVKTCTDTSECDGLDCIDGYCYPP